MSGRTFLKPVALLSLFTIVLITVLTVTGCKGADSPTAANFTINVRDHMTNQIINTILKPGFINEKDGLTVTYAEIIGSNTGYANCFFAVREPNFGTVLGFSLGDPSVIMDTTGTTTLDAYVLKTKSGANYSGVLGSVHAGLVVPRSSAGNLVNRDGQTEIGRENVYPSAFSTINGMLGYTGSSLWIGVNGDKIGSEPGMIRIAISETGQFLTRSGNQLDFNSDAGKYALRAYMCFAE